jgi:ELWxxDGT repeat protein
MWHQHNLKPSHSTVLFIDGNVENYDILLTEIKSNVKVFILDTTKNGIKQITEVLTTNNYQQVHIISHGAPGCLYLGNSQLNLDNLNKYQTELQSWYSTPLSKGGRGDLFLYGCQVAAGDAGAEFLEKLHQLTGANLAASASLTGNEELGGNWNLEVTVGEISADLVLAKTAMASYQGVLNRATLVKDINPGNGNSFPQQLVELNGKLYFAATDNVNGAELWVTDGTTAGTQLLTDINPGGYSSLFLFTALNFTELNGKLYFAANDGANGSELWVTDGTTAGTQLLTDINPVSLTGSFPRYFTELNGKLYFAANDGANGSELWVTDGTTAGTQLLKNIRFGSYDSFPQNFSAFQGKLYFSALNNNDGFELWVTDGTTAGTQLFKDINPNLDPTRSSSNPSEFTEFNGKLYFAANRGVNGPGLWVTDGTTAGTQLVKDIALGSNSLFAQSGFNELNGKLYFAAFDDVNFNGYELWVTDGTTNGTQLLKDINPGRSNSSPQQFIEFDGKLYFSANDGVNGSELWVTDGTTAGTQLVKDINSGSDNSDLSSFTKFNGKLYFAANDGVNGDELWVTDGTTAGTQLVADINPGSGSSYITQLTVVGDRLFFSATDGVNGRELWQLTTSNNITGTAKSDRLIGTAEDDDISGLAGNDTLLGRDGNDILIGGNGLDSLTGGAGDDSLSGDNGNDVLRGNLGNDTLTGGAGGDTLSGGRGSDFLDGGLGNDVLTGELESDIFVLRAGNGRDSISDFQLGIDKLGLADGLTFADLTFSSNRINLGTEVLATLTGVDTTDLTASDFTTI